MPDTAHALVTARSVGVSRFGRSTRGTKSHTHNPRHRGLVGSPVWRSGLLALRSEAVDRGSPTAALSFAVCRIRCRAPCWTLVLALDQLGCGLLLPGPQAAQGDLTPQGQGLRAGRPWEVQSWPFTCRPGPRSQTCPLQTLLLPACCCFHPTPGRWDLESPNLCP